MGVNRVTKRGKSRIEVRRRWPDGTTYRRYFPNMTSARRTDSRIAAAIAEGKWRDLKAELSEAKDRELEHTVESFSEVYLENYCRQFNRRPDFKEQALVSIVQILGKVALEDLTRQQVDFFVAKRRQKVQTATVNRGLAVLRHMLNYAVKTDQLKANPMNGYEKLPEHERALTIMTLEQERRLVEAVALRSPVIGAYVALLGETGLRKAEGLNLKWGDIDWQRRRLTVRQSKTGVPREVPLSDFALDWLRSLTQYEHSPYVFILDSGRPLKEPKETFKKVTIEANLEWVRGFHDLRHFRATQWLIRGVDVYTVKTYLGHKRIETTQRYLHFVPDHAEQSVRNAQRAEARESQDFVGDKWETLAVAVGGGEDSIPLNH